MISYIAIINKNVESNNFQVNLPSKINKILPHYKIELESNELTVLTTGQEDRFFKKYFLNGGNGLILGTIFQRTNDVIGKSVDRQLGTQQSIVISESHGKTLINSYWGNYIAFIHDRNSQCYTVVRDPSCSMPGVYYEDDYYIIFFMDIEDFCKLGLGNFTFDRTHLAAVLKTSVFDLPMAALKEMKKLLGGHALHCKKGQVWTERYWHPADFCEKLAYDDPNVAMNDLRSTVEGCIHAWAGEFDNILLHLSGGLDSTILLSCLNSAPNKPNIIGLNYYTPAQGQDERIFARSAAGHFGVELIEVYNDPQQVDLRNVLEFYLHPDPVATVGPSLHGAVERKIVDERGLDVCMNGEGGDGLFYSTGNETAADYLMRHGINLKLINEARVCAEVRKLAFAKVLASAVFSAFMPQRYSIDELLKKYPPEMMLKEVSDQTQMDEIAAWMLEPLRHLPYAKIEHIAFSNPPISPRAPNRPDWYVPFVSPLLSQPLKELSYKIPTYMFSHGGVSRGLIRMAFLDIAPAKNILRQSKGGVQTIFDEAILNNWAFLKEFYRDSLLVELGVWDRAAVDSVLTGDLSQGSRRRQLFFSGLGFELWLKKMANLGCRA